MRITITDLVDRPGATRPVQDVAELDAFGHDSWGNADGFLSGTIGIDVHLDAVVDGILVRGVIGFDVVMPCSRCLADRHQHVDADVTELFVDPSRDDDYDVDAGYELLDDCTAIDLSTLVRDAVLIDLPMRVLCKPDCAGLCPTCGIDRNTADCGHDTARSVDPRWAALADLQVPPE
ncbi:MAG: DUF177 domain-containing protein [Nitriliruptoraceae bacterium]